MKTQKQETTATAVVRSDGSARIFSARFLVATAGAVFVGFVLAATDASLLAGCIAVAVGVPCALTFVHWPELRNEWRNRR